MEKISIDVTKIKKEWLVDGKYLNMVMIETPGNQYGNRTMVVQDLPKSIWEPEKERKGRYLVTQKCLGLLSRTLGHHHLNHNLHKWNSPLETKEMAFRSKLHYHQV
jgi:hypothetical protein